MSYRSRPDARGTGAFRFAAAGVTCEVSVAPGALARLPVALGRIAPGRWLVVSSAPVLAAQGHRLSEALRGVVVARPGTAPRSGRRGRQELDRSREAPLRDGPAGAGARRGRRRVRRGDRRRRGGARSVACPPRRPGRPGADDASRRRRQRARGEDGGEPPGREEPRGDVPPPPPRLRRPASPLLAVRSRPPIGARGGRQERPPVGVVLETPALSRRKVSRRGTSPPWPRRSSGRCA